MDKDFGKFQAWVGHPNLHFVSNSVCHCFEEKNQENYQSRLR